MSDTPKITLKPIRVLQVRYMNGQLDELPLPKDDKGEYLKPVEDGGQLTLDDPPYYYCWQLSSVSHYRLVDMKMPCYEDQKFVPAPTLGTETA